MTPPWEDFQQSLADCRRLVDRTEKARADYPGAEARKNLDAQRDEALAAYRAQDQQLYGEYWDRLQETHAALKKGLEGEEPELPPLPPSERAAAQVRQMLEDCTALRRSAGNFAAQFQERIAHPRGDETPERLSMHQQQCELCAQELAGGKAALEKLKAQCGETPDDVLAECPSHRALIARWRAVLVAKQAILTGKKMDGLPPIPESDEP